MQIYFFCLRRYSKNKLENKLENKLKNELENQFVIKLENTRTHQKYAGARQNLADRTSRGTKPSTRRTGWNPILAGGVQQHPRTYNRKTDQTPASKGSASHQNAPAPRGMNQPMN
jgi:hypothetical protein